jgi:hypothetical protein
MKKSLIFLVAILTTVLITITTINVHLAGIAGKNQSSATFSLKSNDAMSNNENTCDYTQGQHMSTTEVETGLFFYLNGEKIPIMQTRKCCEDEVDSACNTSNEQNCTQP